MAKFNFDDAMRMRNDAASQGVGKPEWIEFAHLMFDEFPHLYEVAREMTIYHDKLTTQRDDLLNALKFVRFYVDGESLPTRKQAICRFSRANAKADARYYRSRYYYNVRVVKYISTKGE